MENTTKKTSKGFSIFIWIMLSVAVIGAAAALYLNFSEKKKDAAVKDAVAKVPALAEAPNPAATYKQWVVNGVKLCKDPLVNGQYLPCNQISK